MDFFPFGFHFVVSISYYLLENNWPSYGWTNGIAYFRALEAHTHRLRCASHSIRFNQISNYYRCERNSKCVNAEYQYQTTCDREVMGAGASNIANFE